MSADLLRRAAAKLRGHAEKAAAGPWEPRDQYPHLVLQGADAEFLISTTLSDQPGADSQYIALMHPPVALALAELLEVLATEQQTSNPFDLISAESLARAILREPS